MLNKTLSLLRLDLRFSDEAKVVRFKFLTVTIVVRPILSRRRILKSAMEIGLANLRKFILSKRPFLNVKIPYAR